MGKVFSAFVRRPATNWNVENRAQSFIEKQDRPKVAPRHSTTQELLDKFSKEHPEILEMQSKKDESLAKMLQGMVVKPDRMGQIVSMSKKELLPSDRSKLADDEFGYLEPEVIRPGRCSVRQVLQFIGDHYSNPTTHTVESISKQYNLDNDRVERILKYYHVFNVQMPVQKPGSEESGGITKVLKPGFFRRSSVPVDNAQSNKPVTSESK